MSNWRWYHPNLRGWDAECLLLEYGVDGSFLVRPSRSSNKGFTIAVRLNKHVYHIKIQYKKKLYDLYGGQKFVTLSELIQFYSDHPPLRDTTGKKVEFKYPFYWADPLNERWFHKNMDGKKAEKTLFETAKVGTFLVRESQSHLGYFVISVLRSDGFVTHIKVRYEAKYDLIGGRMFFSLSQLVQYFRQNPMMDTIGNTILLKYPLNTTRISASRIESRFEDLDREKGKKSGFWEEFELLQLQEVKHLFCRKEGKKAENKNKNRYKNILPFDHTRVVLKEPWPHDYINANYIKPDAEMFEDSKKNYIATQGCLPSTIADFWYMVWQENTRVIMMTTKVIERSKSKCAHYWPAPGEIKDCEGIKLTHQTSSGNSDIARREFVISKDGEERVIHQFHFQAWPEHGEPDPRCVVDFLSEVNTCQESFPDAGPIVVQCSTGIGRSATFIVIDLIIDQLTRTQLRMDIDVAQTIQMLRRQRSGMVQTEAQYQFVYSALVHFVDILSRKMDEEQKRLLLEQEYANLPEIPVEVALNTLSI